MNLTFESKKDLFKMKFIMYKVLIVLLSTIVLEGSDYTPFLGNNIKGNKLQKNSQSIKPIQKKNMSGFLAKEAKKSKSLRKKANVTRAKKMANKRLNNSSQFNRIEDVKIKQNKALLEKKKKEKQKKKKYQMMKKKR